MRLLLIVSLFLQLSAVERSKREIAEFKKQTGFPNGRPGFVIDHRIPLCAGGPDVMTNMRWEEVRASYVKDAFERELCVEMKRQGYILVKRQ